MNAFDALVVNSMCERAVEYSQQYVTALKTKDYVRADLICWLIEGLASLTENYMSGKESSARHLGGMQ